MNVPGGIAERLDNRFTGYISESHLAWRKDTNSVIPKWYWLVMAMLLLCYIIPVSLMILPHCKTEHSVDRWEPQIISMLTVERWVASVTVVIGLVAIIFQQGQKIIGFIKLHGVSILGTLEVSTTDLLVSSSSLIVAMKRLTRKQEHIGTTFWFDVPCWVQAPGLCHNLQKDIAQLQCGTLKVASSSKNAAVTQVQQTMTLPSAQNIQIPLTQSSSTLPGTSSPSAGPNSAQTDPNQASQPNSGPQPSRPSELHVFMTSKVGGHYLLSQWNTFSQDDQEFFRKLRACYISARGLWRYLFGFRVFSHCEFYRVSRLNLKCASCLTQM
jgi:hypothetical protein